MFNIYVMFGVQYKELNLQGRNYEYLSIINVSV